MLAWFATPVRGAGDGVRVLARVDLRRAAEGAVDVRLELRRAGRFALGSLLASRAFDPRGLVATDADGRALAAERVQPTGTRGADRVRVVVDARGARVPVQVAYELVPGTYLPGDGQPDRRHLGRVEARGCALALPQLLLVPEAGWDGLELELALPDGWRAEVAPPDAISAEDPAALWSEVVVAGAYQAHAAAPGVRLLRGPGTPDPAHAALLELIDALAAALGAPDEPITVAALPPAADGLWIDLPGTPRALAIDVPDADLGSLRRVARELVPRWWSRSAAGLLLDGDPDPWFALGAAERLALRVASGAARAARDPDASLEVPWMHLRELRELDPRRPAADPAPSELFARRLAAAALVHGLDRELAPGRLDAALRDFGGRGAPLELDPAVRDFARRHLDAGQPLAFEQDWRLDLAERPATPPGRPVRSAHLAYTSDTEGFLEHCGCKLSQAGGVARRAAAVGELRGRHPDLVVLDLGNFSPVEPGARELDPLVEREFLFHLDEMARLGCAAAVLGPEDVLAGTPLLERARAGELGFPLLGGGVDVGGERPLPAAALVRAGDVTLGVVGWAEDLELGSLRDAQETRRGDVAFPVDADALHQALAELRPRVDVLVLAGRMRPATLRAACTGAVRVDLALLGGLAGASYARPGSVGFLGDTAVAIDGQQTYGLDHLELFLDPDGRVVLARQQGLRLERERPADPAAQGRLDAFYAELALRLDELGTPEPLFRDDPLHAQVYAGAEACRACHAEQYEQWRATPHATALETLVAQRRASQPKCVRCHVLGLGREPGFDLTRPEERFAGVQCEHCHGAGGEHVRSPAASPLARAPGLGTCLECHDPEHSDWFERDFHDRLERVRH